LAVSRTSLAMINEPAPWRLALWGEGRLAKSMHHERSQSISEIGIR